MAGQLPRLKNIRLIERNTSTDFNGTESKEYFCLEDWTLPGALARGFEDVDFELEAKIRGKWNPN